MTGRLAKDIIRYLLNLTIHINASLVCKLAPLFWLSETVFLTSKQCRKRAVKFRHIEHIFDQIEYAPLHKLNITGGDIFRYRAEEMITLFKKSIVFIRVLEYTTWISNQGCDLLDAYEDVFVTFPLNEDYHRIISTLLGKGKVKIHFVISLSWTIKRRRKLLRSTRSSGCFQVLPFFDGNNKAFFDENVFMSEDDILALLSNNTSFF